MRFGTRRQMMTRSGALIDWRLSHVRVWWFTSFSWGKSECRSWIRSTWKAFVTEREGVWVLSTEEFLLEGFAQHYKRRFEPIRHALTWLLTCFELIEWESKTSLSFWNEVELKHKTDSYLDGSWTSQPPLHNLKLPWKDLWSSVMLFRRFSMTAVTLFQLYLNYSTKIKSFRRDWLRSISPLTNRPHHVTQHHFRLSISLLFQKAFTSRSKYIRTSICTQMRKNVCSANRTEGRNAKSLSNPFRLFSLNCGWVEKEKKQLEPYIIILWLH